MVVLAQLDPTGVFDIVNTSLIFWEIVTFAILVFLLVRYVFPPIRRQIEHRQKVIEGAIDEAEKTRKEAREQGEAQRERAKREAREEGDRIIQRAREEIDRQREEAVRQVRGEVAGMV